MVPSPVDASVGQTGRPAPVKPRALAAAVAARRPSALNPVSHGPEERGEQAGRRVLESPLAVRDADLANDSAASHDAYSWQAAGGDAVDVESPHAEAPPAPLMAGTSAPWPTWRWLIPVSVALLLLAAGVFCLGAQYWVPASLTMDPSKFHGLNVQPWGLFVYQAAPFLLGGGAGILGAVVFLASRRWASRETILRMAFGLFALAVGVAGWVSNFAMVFFPQATQQATSPYDQAPQPAPLAYVLMSCGIWLLALALLMLAVLFVVPRRWRHVWPEAGDDAIKSVPTGRGPSAARGLVFGVVVVAASVFALFAPYMFPMSTGVQTVQSGDGGTYSQQAWAGLAQGLLIPFMLAGMIVLGWGCIHLAVTIRPVGGQTEAGD